jgi:FkbM family methyltransferase
MSIKRAFESFLSELGISPSDGFTAMPAPSFGALFFEFVRRHGYDIANNAKRVLDRLDIAIEEVIDVGVHDGTPWLYARYPDARFVLVEPQKGAEARLKHRPKNFSLINKAVGEVPGTLVLTERAERSSLLDRAHGSGAAVPDAQYVVPVVTLDAVIEENCRSDAIALKVEVEGFEYPALQGLDSQAKRI